jgi:YgiT-type zinc finger domain-containing protein
MRRSGGFGYRCEYCEGIVREKLVQREAFKHKMGFVILENPLIGVCDKCGNRYYSAETLRRVQEIATGKTPPQRTEEIPVASVR